MTEQYLSVRDFYSVTHRKKLYSVGSIPYAYSYLKDETFLPKIPENICNILKKNVDYEQIGRKPKYAYQTIHTCFTETENVGYMVTNPLSLDYIDQQEWNRMCNAIGISELSDFYCEISRLQYSKDGTYAPAAGLETIKYNKEGKIIEFVVRNASFDLNIIENSKHYKQIKERVADRQTVEQLIGINPFNEDVTLEILMSYPDASVSLVDRSTIQTTTQHELWKVVCDPVDISPQTAGMVDIMESYGIITAADKEYINSVRQPNTKLSFSLVFDSEDNIKEVIVIDEVVEKFKRI